ncbi:related to 8-amino-7-oxononanoate synthase [Ustilago trichophora]|uniref:Related to 8-amino-7-oxononanoate synthase n=1 Tax=Ustilago trichophora TaxID=86804 RepID=A0A5C3DVR7_9BASI|nr:related to 8-amino-7-oxononanoate synthase [Ustilago trichophora]
MLDDELQAALDKRAAKGTLRQLTVYPTTPASSSTSSQKLVDFSSNDYLSLATSSRVRAEFASLVASNTSLNAQLGSAGSRLLDGNSSIHEAIEDDLTAHFASSTAGLLFNSGYEANVSLLSTLPQPRDVVIYDELVHASVHDGLRRSRIPAHLRIPFRHNSEAHLREILTRLGQDGALTAGPSSSGGNATTYPGGRNVWLAVESVYSMDGDVCPLRSLLNTMSEYVPDNRICAVIDEAHSTALYGSRGRGLVNALGLQSDPRITARLMTFGKAWGASGAVVLCSKIARHYLINYARPLIFSTALGYPQLAAILASFNSIRDGTAERKARRTFSNSRRLVDGFEGVIRSQKVGTGRCVALPPHLKPNTTSTGKDGKQGGEDDFVSWSMQQPSPIIPLLTAHARDLAAHLRANGLLARPICYPTVPKGEDRVRICVHADNTEEDIDRLINCVRQWVSDDRMQHGGVRKAEQTLTPLLASKL